MRALACRRWPICLLVIFLTSINLILILPLVGPGFIPGGSEAFAQAPPKSKDRKAAGKSMSDDEVARYVTELQTDALRAATLLEDRKLVEFTEDFFPVNDLRAIRERSLTQKIVQDPRFKNDLIKRVADAFRLGAKSVPKLSHGNGVATMEIIIPASKSESVRRTAPKSAEPEHKDTGGFGPDLDKALEEVSNEAKSHAWEIVVPNFYPLSEVEFLMTSGELDSQAYIIHQSPAMQTAFLSDLTAMRESKPLLSERNTVAEWKIGTGKDEHIIRMQLQKGHWRLFDSTAPVRKKVEELIRKKNEDTADGIIIKWERFGNRWRLLSLDFLELFQ